MKSFLTDVFTWWNGATIGTRLWIRRAGERVGEDEQGNVYYRSRRIDPALGRERRWVIYNGEAEASRIPSGWHGWMHHRTDTPPTKEDYKPRDWQLPHKENMTGTAYAYRPAGSIASPEPRPAAEGEYRAWSPGN
ncbi:MAG: NADH:ubiquinone oxidoreductase subunit NDUFA12 [Beijerinckiaceae bacterium]